MRPFESYRGSFPLTWRILPSFFAKGLWAMLLEVLSSRLYVAIVAGILKPSCGASRSYLGTRDNLDQFSTSLRLEHRLTEEALQYLCDLANSMKRLNGK
jgi:hypothetical protein